MLKSVEYNRDDKSLRILDQCQLPHITKYIDVTGVDDGWLAIRQMSVRGAPAIAVVAMLSLAVECHKNSCLDVPWALRKLDHLKTSRPTAVNLFQACDELANRLTSLPQSEDRDGQVTAVRQCIIDYAEALLLQDVHDNRSIGRFGAEFLLDSLGCRDNDKLCILTHCNTGTLATAGFGTALGVIRHLHKLNRLEAVYCTETRPYNQGSRLTAYELVTDKLPGATLITDSMAAYLMKRKRENGKPIHAVIVGADRVAANGDTANKIGTYQLALVARHHGVKFVVAAPTTSIDLSIMDGGGIEIEERSADEVRKVNGYDADDKCMKQVLISPVDINVWNPGFDVTPAKLIDAIVTEKGAILKDDGCDVFDLRRARQATE